MSVKDFNVAARLAVLMLFIFSMSSFSQNLQQPATDQPAPSKDAVKKATPKEKTYISESEVRASIDEISLKIKQEKESNPILAIQFANFANKMSSYAKYPNIEKETGILRDWFVNLNKILMNMYGLRSKMETAVMNRDQNTWEASAVEYKKLVEKFEYQIKHPLRKSGK